MNINVEAVYILSAKAFLTSAGGMTAVWLMLRHDDREFREKMERLRADRG
jgi:hypothetical protein